MDQFINDDKYKTYVLSNTETRLPYDRIMIYSIRPIFCELEISKIEYYLAGGTFEPDYIERSYDDYLPVKFSQNDWSKVNVNGKDCSLLNTFYQRESNIGTN